MAPVASPPVDTSYFEQVGNTISWRPRGANDRSNQEAIAALLKAQPSTRLEMGAGTFMQDYMEVWKDLDCEIVGAGPGATTVVWGLPSAVIAPLDDDDRKIFNGSGVPFGWVFCESATGGTDQNILVRDIKFKTPDLKGYDAFGWGDFQNNMHMRGGMFVTGKAISPMVWDLEKTLSGTGPHP